MNKGIWIMDRKTGDHILYIGSAEVSRIKIKDITGMSKGEPCLDCYTLPDLKARLAKEAGCSE